MDTGALFYFPTLHPEFAPAPALKGMLFIPSGLTPLPEDAPPALRAFADALPLSRREASAVLSELLQLAAERSVETQASERHAAPNAGRRREENAALDTFARTGRVADTAGDPVADAEELRRSECVARQKLLLLAYSLEEQMAGIREVEQRLLDSEAALGSLLRDDPNPRDGLSGMSFSPPVLPLLSAVATFLPPEAALYVDDPAVARELQALAAFAPAGEDMTRRFPPLRGMCSLVGYAGRAALRVPAGEAVDRSPHPGDDLTIFLSPEAGAL